VTVNVAGVCVVVGVTESQFPPEAVCTDARIVAAVALPGAAFTWIPAEAGAAIAPILRVFTSGFTIKGAELTLNITEIIPLMGAIADGEGGTIVSVTVPV